MPKKLKDNQEEVSMKNTKAELLDAYNTLFDELKRKEEAALKPEKIKEEKQKNEVVKVADTIISNGAIKQIRELQESINKELTSLGEKMDKEAEEYLGLKNAISIKQKELEEIYGIEKEAMTLAGLLETQKIKKEEFDLEMTERKKQLEEEILQTRTEWQKEREAHALATKEAEMEEKKRRERDIEEFKYQFKREQELSKNKFADEAAKQVKELAEKKESIEKELAEKEKSIEEREANLESQEKRTKELEGRVASFDAEMSDNRDKIIKETTDSLTRQHNAEKALMTKQYEGEINVLNTKIETLQGIISDQKKQIDNQIQQLEKSYKKVEEIAMKALDHTQASKIMANYEQMIREKPQATRPEN